MEKTVPKWKPRANCLYKTHSKKTTKDGHVFHKNCVVVVTDEYGKNHSGSFKQYASGNCEIKYGKTRRFIEDEYLKFKKTWEMSEKWVEFRYNVMIIPPTKKRGILKK